MGLWQRLKKGFSQILVRPLNRCLQVEDRCFEPIEKRIGMKLGRTSRYFFPLALVTQLFLLYAHSTQGFYSTGHTSRLLIACLSLLSVAIMTVLSCDSICDLGMEMRAKKMPHARLDSHFASFDDLFTGVLYLTFFHVLFSVGLGDYSWWYLGLNIIMAMITAVTALKHVQACHILTNKDDLPKIVHDQDKAKTQRQQILRLQSTIDDLNHQRHQENDEFEERLEKLTDEKIDLVDQLTSKKALIEELRDTKKEYGSIIDWYDEQFRAEMKRSGQLNQEKRQLESDKVQLAKRNVDLVGEKTELARCHEMYKQESWALIDHIAAAQRHAAEKHSVCCGSRRSNNFQPQSKTERSGDYYGKAFQSFQAQVELLKRDNDDWRKTHERWLQWYNDVFCKNMVLYDQACAKVEEMEENLNIAHVTLEACRLTLAKRTEELEHSQSLRKACRLTLAKKNEELARSESLRKQYQDLWLEATRGADDSSEDDSDVPRESIPTTLLAEGLQQSQNTTDRDQAFEPEAAVSEEGIAGGRADEQFESLEAILAEFLANEELEEQYEADDESDVGEYAEVNEVASEIEYDESDCEFVLECDTDDEMSDWSFVESDDEL